MIKTRCGVFSRICGNVGKTPAKRDFPTRWGDCKNEAGCDVCHIYEHVVIHFLGPKLENKVTHDGKVPKPEKRD